ncbi:AMP-binding protein [Ichthyenterobacterium sp. W332]|uniref:AMP-binding protein n=1 Tax=Microcosmobacter mediterraneus TaxID=3075607 RepID=A0ABU2YNL8_9FLAO|nr:AMP-binding protein [Ichthyenterobacterium sp. W332]MDT0559427.1 AMP-binding protein [Ichthyenterobacterium sp. W332]
MIPHFNKVHNRFKLDGRYFNQSSLKEVAYSYVKEGESYEKSIGDFLLDWLNSSPFIQVKTSGSTGAPKTIQLQKQAMVHSAIATGDFFKLQPGDSALLCLPADFIAGKMMLVRAMILGLEIDVTVPTSKPYLLPNKTYKFVAMTPMQLENSVDSINAIETLIIGGAKVSTRLKEKVKHSKTMLFETYGMTETITHVAVKPFNTHYFKTLPSIQISKDKRGCLELIVPYISKKPIITNDMVAIHSETEFEWLGRYDNVINSGGVKIHPEQLEAQLSKHLDYNFFFTSITDDQLGDRLVLVLETDSNTLDTNTFDDFDKFNTPKDIYCVSKFSYTKSGKIDRAKTLNSIAKLA